MGFGVKSFEGYANITYFHLYFNIMLEIWLVILLN